MDIDPVKMAREIMDVFWPQIAYDLGECHIEDLVETYLSNECKRLDPVMYNEVIDECYKLNFGDEYLTP